MQKHMKLRAAEKGPAMPALEALHLADGNAFDLVEA